MAPQKLNANGITFNTLTEGPEGAPWIVLSNSLATNLTMWDEFAAFMSDRYRVFRYDQRGHGGTDAPPPPYPPAQLVDDVVALMDVAGIQRAHFVGLSMGGSTGLGLVHRFPERVISLTMCDCRASAAGIPGWNERIRVAREDGMDATVDATVSTWFTQASRDANIPAIDKLKGMVRTTKVDGYVGCIEALKVYDYSSYLDSVGKPTLLVVGEQDGDRPKSMAEDAKRIPGARLVVVPNAGHISNIENPDAFNKLVGPFIDSVKS